MVLAKKLDDTLDTEESIWNRLDGLLHSLSRQKTAWVFLEPVDPVKAGAPDYFDIIKCATQAMLPIVQLLGSQSSA